MHEYQQAVFDAIYGQNTDMLYSQIHTPSGVSGQESIAIYRNNTLGSQYDALADFYPVIKKILGTQYFRQITRPFILQYPSKTENLNHYGQEFSSYLSNLITHRPELQDYPYLPDLARLELAYHQCYFALNDDTFDFNGLSQLNNKQYAQLYFVLSHSLALIESNYPIDAIWLANQQEKPDHHIQNKQNQYQLIVYRDHYQPKIMQTTSELFDLLMAIRQKKSLLQLTQLATYNETIIPTCIQRTWIQGFFWNETSCLNAIN